MFHKTAPEQLLFAFENEDDLQKKKTVVSDVYWVLDIHEIFDIHTVCYRLIKLEM